MTKHDRTWLIAAFSVLLMLPGAAQAYTGPGLGMGAVSVALGVLGSLFLGILAVVWYPVKRLLRAFRSKRKEPETPDEPPPE